MEVAGVVAVLGASVAIVVYVVLNGPRKGQVVSALLVTVFVGTVLILNKRVTEVAIPGVGTIKAAAERATVDAQAIAELRTRIEGQASAIDRVAADASRAEALAESVDRKASAADEKMSQLSTVVSTARDELSGLEVAADSALQDVGDAYGRILGLEEQVRLPTLNIQESHVDEADNGLRLVVGFMPSRFAALGVVSFRLSVEPDSSATITEIFIKPEAPGLIKVSQAVAEDGKTASMIFQPQLVTNFWLHIGVSGDTQLLMMGSHGVGNLSFEVSRRLVNEATTGK